MDMRGNVDISGRAITGAKSWKYNCSWSFWGTEYNLMILGHWVSEKQRISRKGPVGSLGQYPGTLNGLLRGLDFSPCGAEESRGHTGVLQKNEDAKYQGGVSLDHYFFVFSKMISLSGFSLPSSWEPSLYQ